MTLTMMDRLALACRRIFLSDHEVRIGIGAHEHERHRTQPVLINVELWVPLQASTPSDDRLDEVLDYDFVRHAIAALTAHAHVTLQETLCDEIAAAMMANPAVTAARVSTRKPEAYADSGAVGVEVFRLRAN